MKKSPQSKSAATARRKPASRESLETIAALFRVFGDASRLQILQALTEGEKNVGQLTESLNLTQANVSKHLRTLHEANLLRRERRGTSTYYQIDDDFMHPLCELICDKLNRTHEKTEKGFPFSV